MRSLPVRPAMLLAALSLLLTGCIHDVVSPQVSPQDSARSTPGADPMTGTRIDDPHPTDGGSPAATTAMPVVMGQAATLRAGRFTLFLHKNALKQNATVTMWVPDTTSMQVEITVTPSEANDFQVPARVTADLTDQGSIDLSKQTMYYWDGSWEVPNDVVVDTTAHTVMATMHQLSTCRVGAVQHTTGHTAN